MWANLAAEGRVVLATAEDTFHRYPTKPVINPKWGGSSARAWQNARECAFFVKTEAPMCKLMLTSICRIDVKRWSEYQGADYGLSSF